MFAASRALSFFARSASAYSFQHLKVLVPDPLQPCSWRRMRRFAARDGLSWRFQPHAQDGGHAARFEFPVQTDWRG
jgi:hypothetical protein